MRNLFKLSIIFCCLLLAQQLFASPLVFRATKVVTTNELAELGTFDATKFSRIRIVVKLLDRSENTVFLVKSEALTELNRTKRDVERQLQLYERGIISKASYDNDLERLQMAQRNYDNALENIFPPVTITGIDDGEEIPLGIFEKLRPANSIILEVPPSKIKIQVFGKGTYKLLVWGVL